MSHSNTADEVRSPTSGASRRTSVGRIGLPANRLSALNQVDDLVDNQLVAWGVKTQSWKDWGFPTGFAHDRALQLQRALLARATGAELDSIAFEGLSKLDAALVMRQVDWLLARTGLSAGRLAEDLAHDIKPWKSYSETEKLLSQVRHNQGRIHAAVPFSRPVKEGKGFTARLINLLHQSMTRARQQAVRATNVQRRVESPTQCATSSSTFSVSPVAGDSRVKAIPSHGASSKAVREWMRRRVADWPHHKSAPTEDEDWRAARDKFGGNLPRSDFRSVRNEETPPQWRTQGPRRAWGVAKITPA
jgi:hypothetical protein